MSNIDRLRVDGTDYDIQSVVKVYNTIADMNADIANIPNGATVFVKENSPSGLEGDDELDPTSSNWVKNSALAEVVVTVEDGSSTPSIPDSELRHSDMSNTQVNDVNKVPTSALVYQMNSDLASKLNWIPFGNHNIGNYQPQSNFPSNWSEMLFVFKYSTILLEVHLPKNVVDAYSGTDPDAMYNGFYYTPTINAGVVVTYNKTKFSAYGFYYNGASVASSATCTAYYR